MTFVPETATVWIDPRTGRCRFDAIGSFSLPPGVRVESVHLPVADRDHGDDCDCPRCR